MIRVFIDNHEIFLKKGFSSKYVRENCFFSKNGDYTYDLDVDCSIPQNARVFIKELRTNSVIEANTRNAELWNGTRLIGRGGAKVLRVTGKNVKVQLLCNNSAINADSNTKVRSLDLGKIDTVTVEYAEKLWGKFYGDTVDGSAVEVAFPLICVGEKEENVRNWIVGSTGKNYKSNENLLAQPFVLSILDKFVSKLGYEIIRNDINKEKYKHLVIIHAYETNEFSKMLPNWTVAEMITEFEKFFNVYFNFNSIDMKLSIISTDKFYEDKELTYIDDDQVLDEQIRECSEAEPVQNTYLNVGYKLPESDWWNFQNMKDELYQICTKEERTYGKDMDNIDDYKFIVFYDKFFDLEWMKMTKKETDDEKETTNSGNVGDIYDEVTHVTTWIGTSNFDYTGATVVNQYKDVVRNNKVEKTELKIVPAAEGFVNATFLFPGADGERPYSKSCSWTIPNAKYIGKDNQTFSDVVRDGLNSMNGEDVMQVGFYIGLNMLSDSDMYKQAIVICSYYACTAKTLKYYHDSNGTPIDRTFTMELGGKHGRVATDLNNDIKLDTTDKHIIKFVSKEILDPQDKFVIKNRLYYCKQLKYSMDEEGLGIIVEGEFYPETNASEIIDDSVTPTFDDISLYVEACFKSSVGVFYSYPMRTDNGDYYEIKYPYPSTDADDTGRPGGHRISQDPATEDESAMAPSRNYLDFILKASFNIGNVSIYVKNAVFTVELNGKVVAQRFTSGAEFTYKHGGLPTTGDVFKVTLSGSIEGIVSIEISKCIKFKYLRD